MRMENSEPKQNCEFFVDDCDWMIDDETSMVQKKQYCANGNVGLLKI